MVIVKGRAELLSLALRTPCSPEVLAAEEESGSPLTTEVVAMAAVEVVDLIGLEEASLGTLTTGVWFARPGNVKG